MSLPDRASLLSILDTYIAERHAGGDVTALIDAGVRLTENGMAVAADAGFWQGVTPTAYRLSFCDPSTGQVGCHATFSEDKLVGIYALRLRVNGNGRIAEAEALVARKGDSNAFAPHRLTLANEAFEQPVRTTQTREQLIEIADAYFDAVEKSDTTTDVIAPDCDRVENGLRTTNNPAGGLPWDCREGMKIFGYIDRVRDRRYPLVDEARGLVWAGAVLEVPKDSVLPLVIDGKPIERPRRSARYSCPNYFASLMDRSPPSTLWFATCRKARGQGGCEGGVIAGQGRVSAPDRPGDPRVFED